MNSGRKRFQKRKHFGKNYPPDKKVSFSSFNRDSCKVNEECCDENDTFILEGKACIPNKKNRVFYNKTQRFNRDLSIILIKSLELYVKNINKNNENVLFRGFNILELLGASGIRSIRYAKELTDSVNHITTNDIDSYAYKQIRKNYKLNKIDKGKYTVLCNDANIVMHILNVHNAMQTKRKYRHLEVGYTFKRKLCNFNSYFKEAFRFLKIASAYRNPTSTNCTNNTFSTAIDGTNIGNGKDTNGENHANDSGEENLSDDELEKKCEEAMQVAEQREELMKNNDVESIEQEKIGEVETTCRNESENKDEEKNMAKIAARVVERYLFDIIDVDPYGSSIDFLDSCLKYGRSNFFILVTNTDMRILNGKYPEVSFYKYNNMFFSKKGIYCYEYSIRAILYKIKTIASKYKKSVIPFFSLNIDFYIRLLIQVVDDPMLTKDLCVESGMVYQCSNCCSFHVIPLAQRKEESYGGKKGKRKKSNNKEKEDEEEENHELNEENDKLSSESSNGKHEKPKEDRNEGNFQQEEKENEKEVNYVNDITNDNNKRNNINGTKPLNYKYRCNTLSVSKNCEECNGTFLVGGPIYIGKLHNKDFLKVCLNVIENSSQYGLDHVLSLNRIGIQCRCLMQELNIPLYYNLIHLFRTFRICAFPRHLMANALINLNYQVSYFHRDPSSIKTDAPNHIFMDVFRAVLFKVYSKKGRNKWKGESFLDDKKVLVHNTDTTAAPEKMNGNGIVTNGMRNGNDVINTNEHFNGVAKNQPNGINKKYSIDTIEDEKLKQKLLTYDFFKKASSISMVSFKEKVKNEKVKLFSLENPEPFWGPQKKHCSKI